MADWQPVCDRCENFDSFEWQVPPRVSRLAAATYVPEEDGQDATTIDVDGKPVEDAVNSGADAGKD